MASQAFKNFRAGLPAPAECLAILVGIAEVSVFGLAALANPLEFGNSYGIPMTSSTALQQHPGALQSSEIENKRSRDVHRTQQAYITAIAARNIHNGILILTFACYLRDRRALGIAIAAKLFTTAADFLIVKSYGVKDMVWSHVFGMVSSLTIGGSLLYWGRDDKLW
ncbi:hypothetical protein M433DRAFT_134105 [Acidomyces richmondensis BFW]|nr:MAG: hypothetical protein FE78DRAFT_79217 [Acidomyces sp. 'richmondensis']KYG46118.1 hypothetical protein M433DRAFT_134105 [Acidomyces richmondensis BFW]